MVHLSQLGLLQSTGFEDAGSAATLDRCNDWTDVLIVSATGWRDTAPRFYGALERLFGACTVIKNVRPQPRRICGALHPPADQPGPGV